MVRISSAVITRCTPSTAAAALTSIERMLACATVLRKIFPYSMPGKRMLCMYSARPVTFSRPSSRGTERPTCVVWSIAVFMAGSMPVRGGERLAQRTLHVNSHELLLVGRGPVLVADDGGLVRRRIPLPAQQRVTDACAA